MSQTLSLKEKFNLLVPTGVQPVLDKKGVPKAGTIAGCCGSVGLNSYGSVEETLSAWKQRIYWKATKDIENIPDVYTSECLLVPDLTGNLSLQWEDT